MKKKKKKVVLIQGLLAPYRLPIYQELSNNKDWNFEVWFMSRGGVKNRSWDTSIFEKYNFIYRFLNGWTINVGKKDNYPFWLNPFIHFDLVKYKPDVVLMFGWDSLTSFLAHVSCRLLGIKFLIWSGSTINEVSWRRSLTIPFVKAHVRRADALIAYGTRAKEYLMSLGARKEKIAISYNTNDVDRYRKNALKYKKIKDKTIKDLGLTSKRIIIYYGQVIERKGADLLIKAFQKVKEKYPKSALLIIGSGPFKPDLEKYVSKKKIKDVKFIENPGDEKIGKYYAVSDLFVLPSREEVWGLVVNEAMASGLPVVVSDNAGCAVDIVKPGDNGYVFKSGSVNSLATCLEKVIKDEKKMRNMGKRSLEIMKSFHPKKTAKEITKKVNSVCM
jgi:glycosyltransferase involved in cell wall biosynthesis